LSPGTEPSAEVLERWLEPDLGRIELPHGRGQAVLGEVVRIDIAGGGDQLHGPHRWLVVPVGKHVDVGVGDALAVELARRLGQAAVGERTLVHQRSQRLSEGFRAWAGHRRWFG